MKKLKELQIRTLFLMFSLVVSALFLDAQTTIYRENFGTPSSTTLIQNYNGWQDNTVLYSGDGTCDVRITSASQGYGFASGGGNVMINDTVKWFQISRLNTAADTNLSLYCGLRKTAANNGSPLVVEVSADSVTWTRLWMQDTLPSGTGTSGWYRVRFPGVPSCTNLHVRFSSSANVEFRLDDISLVIGQELELETVAKPKFSPVGGTYYAPQQVAISSQTPEATIYYTIDGTVPTTSSTRYNAPLAVTQSQVIKAFAVAAGMYDSEVATATYVILDTNSLVNLPFDISTNSANEHLDITQMSGFRSYSLGSSYADGSAKFESSRAGSAALVAHLDGAPHELSFDLKGKNGGSNPAAYEGIRFVVSQSADGSQWDNLITLTGADIVVDEFVRFDDLILNADTRFIRWKLEEAEKGNTQLNNIVITKQTDPVQQDTTAVLDYNLQSFAMYPNPTNGVLRFDTGGMHLQRLVLLNLKGQQVDSWSDTLNNTISIAHVPEGTYVLQIITQEGIMYHKVVKY